LKGRYLQHIASEDTSIRYDERSALRQFKASSYSSHRKEAEPSTNEYGSIIGYQLVEAKGVTRNMFRNVRKTRCIGQLLTVALLLWSSTAGAEDREDLNEPVYRVGNTNSAVATERAPLPTRPELDSSLLPPIASPVSTDAAPGLTVKHPALLAALKDASICLDNIQGSIQDYSCLLLRRENVNGKLLKPEYIYTKVRNRRLDGDKVVVPFSVYMKFLKPDDVKGREIIYIEGQNNGKMLVKEGGMRGRLLPSIWLDTRSLLVMRTCRYPISDVGIQTLTEKLLERGHADDGNVANEDYVAEYRDGAKLNGRECKYLKIDFFTQKPVNEASRLEIFIDKSLMVPIRYVAYDWPKVPLDGKKPPILEEYTYLKLELNKKFKDADFDPENPKYNF
jgi:hypothetical protein